ncbi:MAG: ATP-binding protein [Burkholderiaceae bacterium]
MRCLHANPDRTGAIIAPALALACRACGSDAMALLVAHEPACSVLAATVNGPYPSLSLDLVMRAAISSGEIQVLSPSGNDALGGWLSPGGGHLLILPLALGERTRALLVAAHAPAGPILPATSPEWASVRSLMTQSLVQACRLDRAETVLRGIEDELPGFVFEYEQSPSGGGRFPYVSHRIEELTGLDPPTLARDGRALLSLISADQMALMHDAFVAASAAEHTMRGKLRLSLPDGRSLWLMGCAKAIRYEHGTTWHGMAFDATGLMQLREDKARAEDDSRRMSDFVSRVTHEIRTPLAGLLGYIQLMNLDRTDPLSEPQRRRLEQIELAGHRLMELVNGVLDLSRIEHDKDSVVLEPVDLNELIDETLTLLAPLADAHGIGLQFDASELSAIAHGERRALLQVLTNLVSNAIKFNRPGGHVRVAVHRRPGRLRLAVSDEGVGLTADEISQLFTPFKRFARHGLGVEGTGLGLTIARRLTEAMGGTIQVWSHPGDGATFEIELARVDDPSVHEPVEGAPAPAVGTYPPGSVAGADLPAANILYVEDDRLNAAVFSAACERFPQWDVHVAASLGDALAYLKQKVPDLLVTDLSLPDGSGLDVLRFAREHGGMGRRPIVALSATSAPDSIRDALDAGFDDYWTKPVEVTTMLARMAGWLASASPASTPTRTP